MKNVQEDEIAASIRTKPEAHTIEEDPRNDKTTANDASMYPDPSIVYTSDDPRKGGKVFR